MNINTLAALTNPKMILFGMITFIAAEFFLRLILKKDKYNWKEASSSLGVAWGYVFFEMGVLPVKFIVLSWLWKFRLFDIDMNSLWNFFLLFLAADFCYYWTHRLSHNSHWFWLSHSIHHSSTQLTMATSYRLGWTHYLSGGGIFWAPLVLIGFPPLYVILTVTLVISYQLWLHTELVPKIPYIELY
jgi:sterol desaturase/sphingolipid hydroxylase (fatty acid hydroxylase superfamily)